MLDKRPILQRVGQDVAFTPLQLAMDMGFPRSSMSAVVRGEQAGRMDHMQRAALVSFLQERRDRIDALLLELL